MNEYYLYSFIVMGSLLFLVLLAYLPRMVAWFGSFRPSLRLHNAKRNKLAILVPARNESASISPLLESLAKQDYSNFEVFVIVKETNDPTISLAKAWGFHAIAVPEQTCKSDALDGAVQRILKQDQNAFDAYIILDADTMIRQDYLNEMNNAMASGRDVIVSKKIVKNYFLGKGSLTLQGAANGYIWTLFDEMGNKWKSAHHIANFTVGSGLLISKKIMLANDGWGYKSTLTEDCELAGDIIANHWSTFYAEYAPIYMEEAPTLGMTDKRRNRWMGGLTSAQRLYRYKDFSLGSFWDVYFSYSIFIAYLYFALLVGFALGNGIASIAMLIFSQGSFWWPFYGCLGSLALIYFSFLVPGFIAYLSMGKDIKNHRIFRLLSLLYMPLHYFGYFKIMIKVFLGRGVSSWEEIARVKTKEIR
jgi:cellulose synthase/poly-beta-1,6-N-acetylglucosamine synthase-like glycosyltransferase